MIKTKFKSILCLDGNIPEKTFFESFNLTIIAADGAADALLKIGVTPEVIIGDLDSCDTSKHRDSIIIKDSDQNKSDFTKASKYIKKQKLFPCLVVGVSGGYIDHILNNINIFSQYDYCLFDGDVWGRVYAESFKLSLPIQSKISLFGWPKCLLSSRGLKWNLDNFNLIFPGANSCFNRTTEQQIDITIKNGKCLVLVYSTFISDAGIL